MTDHIAGTNHVRGDVHQICKRARRWVLCMGRGGDIFDFLQAGQSWPCSLHRRRWSCHGHAGEDCHSNWWVSALSHLGALVDRCKSHLGKTDAMYFSAAKYHRTERNKWNWWPLFDTKRNQLLFLRVTFFDAKKFLESKAMQQTNSPFLQCQYLHYCIDTTKKLSTIYPSFLGA